MPLQLTRDSETELPDGRRASRRLASARSAEHERCAEATRAMYAARQSSRKLSFGALNRSLITLGGRPCHATKGFRSEAGTIGFAAAAAHQTGPGRRTIQTLHRAMDRFVARGKYMPHQGEREIDRGARHAARAAGRDHGAVP